MPDPRDHSVEPPTAEVAKKLIDDATVIDREMFAERYAAIQERVRSTPGFEERLKLYEAALNKW